MIFIVYNLKKNPEKFIEHLTKKLLSLKEKVYTTKSYPLNKQDIKNLKKSKLIITLGGDGTVLSLFPFIIKATLTHIPIVPVHFGTLGFICSVDPKSAEKIVLDYLNPKKIVSYKENKKSFLKITYKNKYFYSLNEAYLSKGDLGKAIEIEANIGKTIIANFRSDGVIIASPIGSTAYNLAAGGPIVASDLKAIIFNPVCPHSLTAKPIVISGKEIITIKAKSNNSKILPKLILDGKIHRNIDSKAPITCQLDKREIIFLRPKKQDYYHLLKTKLSWLKN